MRNQSTGGAGKAGPSSVDKAGNKKGMPKPGNKQGTPKTRGSEKPAPRGNAKSGGGGGAKKPEASVTRGTDRPAPRSAGTKVEAGSRPKAVKPKEVKKPVRGQAPRPVRPTAPTAPTAAPTPTPDASINRTYTPAQKAAMNNDKRYGGYANRLGMGVNPSARPGTKPGFPTL